MIKNIAQCIYENTLDSPEDKPYMAVDDIAEHLGIRVSDCRMFIDMMKGEGHVSDFCILSDESGDMETVGHVLTPLGVYDLIK